MNYFKYLITVGKASLLGLLVVILMGILPIIIEEGPFDTGMYFWLSVISLVSRALRATWLTPSGVFYATILFCCNYFVDNGRYYGIVYFSNVNENFIRSIDYDIRAIHKSKTDY